MLYTQLQTDPTENRTTLNILISQTKYKYLPLNLVKFNKHKHKKSNWIATGIIRSITYRDKLHNIYATQTGPYIRRCTRTYNPT